MAILCTMPLAEAGPGKPLVGATGVLGDHIDDGERDPHTIAEEQRIRSALTYEAGLEDPLRIVHAEARARRDPSRRGSSRSARAEESNMAVRVGGRRGYDPSTGWPPDDSTERQLG